MSPRVLNSGLKLSRVGRRPQPNKTHVLVSRITHVGEIPLTIAVFFDLVEAPLRGDFAALEVGLENFFRSEQRSRRQQQEQHEHKGRRSAGIGEPVEKSHH